MKTSLITLSAIVAGLILSGCNSDTTDATQTGTLAGIATTSSITGTVPGTLIEAFCIDGSYYKVNSHENNTTEHPFEITIPNSVECRLVMTTNEDNETTKVITPIGIITADGNGTLFKANDSIDIGHIPLAMSRDDINDTNNDGVSDDIYLISIVNGQLVRVELDIDQTDKDGNGLLNVYEDDDNDGICNHDDDDDDNDGTLDIDDYDHDNDGISENDLDGDGVSNDQDCDDDNDGIKDNHDLDDDNDGINDDDDSDDDNDGIDDYNDYDMIHDDDHDGVSNEYDSDDDNDGIDDDYDNDHDSYDDDSYDDDYSSNS